jgi:aminomethyltransferase
VTKGTLAGVAVEISRTGYTGDLGYEIWMPAEHAVTVWDALMDHGKAFDIHAAGMLALDVSRIEAGLLLIDIDFNSSKKALSTSRSILRSKWDWDVWSISTRIVSLVRKR